MNKENQIYKRFLLTIKEASNYFNIGETKLRELLKNPQYDFILLNGNKKLIKREKFENWLNNTYEI